MMIQQVKKKLVFLLMICLVSCEPDSPYITVGLESGFEIKVAEAIYKEGISIINGTHQFPYSCPLDLEASKIKSGIKFSSYFNLDVNKLVPTLGDLKPKYIMLKKKNEPLIYGIKAEDTLAFKLIDFPK